MNAPLEHPHRGRAAGRILAVAGLIFTIAAHGGDAATDVDGAAIASADLGAQWLSYGRNYSEQRFSPLDSIDRTTVTKLGLQWYLDLPDTHSLESTPLAVDGVLYFTTSWGVVHAVDAAGGKELWTYDPQALDVLAQAPERLRIQWGTNRGVAFWKGKVYVGTPDGRLVALAADTGKPVWSVQTFDPATPRYITGAPRAFNGKIIIGHGGGDVGSVRGYVTAYDAETGKQAWRWYAVPGDPAQGFEDKAMAMAAKTWRGEWWKLGGGGAMWNAITYDPELNRIYLGTGNGVPWNQKLRSPGGGDNLFICSIVALDANTGRYLWHYQLNPGDTWDLDAAAGDLMQATLPIDGKPRKLLMTAAKNGFFYVLDRTTGKLISADQFGKQTWAKSIDLKTGRPVEISGARFENGEVLMWPGSAGAHNWQSMSFNPGTGLVYIPTLSVPGFYNDRGIDPAKWRSAEFAANFGINGIQADIPVDAGSSALIAWDPLARKEKWRDPLPSAWPAGTLTTKGGLVFEGDARGEFIAYDAADGRQLWSFDAERGIVAPPISYSVNGIQYISVLVDWSGGAVEQGGGSLFSQFGWTYHSNGRRLLTFAIDGTAKLPPTQNLTSAPIDVPDYQIDPAQAQRGAVVYAQTCFACHGSAAISGGATPDLRASTVAADPASFAGIVHDGALKLAGMPQFNNLTPDDVQALYAYIRERARAALQEKNSKPKQK
jgi:quinohemoprotein ethanol dehydrogenase